MIGPGRRARLALFLLAVALTVAGCGEDAETTTTDSGGVGAEIAGSTAALAQCRDWNRGTEEKRYATIEDVRAAHTPQSAPSDAEPVLSDEEAYNLFERTCSNDFAVAFRLYKVYGQAQAFAPLRPPTE